jgi:DNA mismatch repair protein MSH6
LSRRTYQHLNCHILTQDTVVDRAEQVSGEFFEAFKRKLATRRRSALPVVAQADFRYLMSLVSDNNSDKPYTNLGGKAAEIKIIRDAVAAYVG